MQKYVKTPLTKTYVTVILLGIIITFVKLQNTNTPPPPFLKKGHFICSDAFFRIFYTPKSKKAPLVETCVPIIRFCSASHNSHATGQ